MYKIVEIYLFLCYYYNRGGLMDTVTVILLFITLFIISVVLIIVVLSMFQNKQKKIVKRQLDNLEVEKNKISSTPIIPELSKVESYLKNEKLEAMYNKWKERLDDIREEQIPKITDMLLEAEFSLNKMDYKSTLYKIAKLEMEIYKVRTNSEFLLNEIKEITSSEERNRAIITKFKATYRSLFEKFDKNRGDYGEIENSIELQFENIAKRFEMFETMMENNDYVEITTIIKSIDEMLKHMNVVIEETPSIYLLAKSVLPRKIEEAKLEYDKLVKEGYPLDYLNVEYNIDEANKKINDILDRCKVLNLEDSLLELKVLSDYFDSLFNDYEKEKINKNNYSETNRIFKAKLDKLNRLMSKIFEQLGEIKRLYNLSDEDIKMLEKTNVYLENLNNDYKSLIDHTGNNTFAYSKLEKEIHGLTVRLGKIQDNVDVVLNSIGEMQDDEARAHQQLDEIKLILKESKAMMRTYNLPIIPNNYYVELEEAQAAIKEIIKELEKTPITVEVLNTRVDTARDLVLKLYNTTKDLIKGAKFAEMAIVYGNRYRSSYDELDKFLTYSEKLFFQGDYVRALDITINSLNKIENGIYDKLKEMYSRREKI